MIESKSQVPVDHQRLFLRGAELDDEKTVKEQNITEGNTLTLMTGYNIQVKVPSKNETLDFVVERSDTIESIKARISADTNIDQNLIRIRLNGVELTNAQRVDETDIHEGSLITATLNQIKVTVELPNETLELNVDPADKVMTIKD